MLNLSQPLAHITARFILDGTEYEVEHYHLDFRQPTDFKGQPQHETKGGQLILEIPQIADDALYEWAKNPVRRKDCMVLFDNEMSGTVFRVVLSEAYCVKLTRTVDVFRGTHTTLVIAPETVILNDVTHTNNWKS